MNASIQRFLSSPAFGVVGASTDREKYGNKVLRCLVQNGRVAYPVNPKAPEVEGIPTVATVADLPPEVQSISVMTPPKVTEQVVQTAITKGIKHVWMQPGAESAAAVKACLENGLTVIADGTCLLVVLGYKER